MFLDEHDRFRYVHRNPSPRLRRQEERRRPYVFQFLRRTIGLTDLRTLLGLAHVIENDESGHAYVHYLNTDKRLDEWVSEELIRPATEHEARTTVMGPSPSTTNGIQTRKRKRGSDAAQPSPTTRRVSNAANTQPDTSTAGEVSNGAGTQPNQPRELTEEEYDIQQHRKLFSKRNFDKVVFGQWQIKTWYVRGLRSALWVQPVHLGFFYSI